MNIAASRYVKLNLRAHLYHSSTICPCMVFVVNSSFKIISVPVNDCKSEIKMDGEQSEKSDAECPICGKYFATDAIEVHVNRCIFFNSTTSISETTKDNNKRTFSIFNANKANPLASPPGNAKKKTKNTNDKSNITTEPFASPSTSTKAFQASSATTTPKSSLDTTKQITNDSTKSANPLKKSIPLAEQMRPETIDDYVGQSHIMDKNAVLRRILDKNETPSMILWGPPGVGKTTLAHVIANRSKQTQNIRFVKLSATMAGVNDIKQAVAAAKNEQKFGRKTILFMDEIHRFNKLQQVNHLQDTRTQSLCALLWKFEILKMRLCFVFRIFSCHMLKAVRSY